MNRRVSVKWLVLLLALILAIPSIDNVHILYAKDQNIEENTEKEAAYFEEDNNQEISDSEDHENTDVEDGGGQDGDGEDGSGEDSEQEDSNGEDRDQEDGNGQDSDEVDGNSEDSDVEGGNSEDVDGESIVDEEEAPVVDEIVGLMALNVTDDAGMRAALTDPTADEIIIMNSFAITDGPLPVNMNGNLNIRAASPVTLTIGSAKIGRHMVLGGNGLLHLENITLDGENRLGTGGIYMQEGSNIEIKGNNTSIIRNNDVNGGGILSDSDNLVLSGDLKINNNTGYAASGAASGVTVLDGDLTIFDYVQITYNRHGAGVVVSNGKTIVSDYVEIAYNEHDDGDGQGGGIMLFGSSDLFVSGNVKIHNNIASYGGGISSYSGGLLCISGDVEIYDNTAQSWGGGVFASSGNEMKIEGNVKIYNNEATDGFGGGVYHFGGATLTLAEKVEIFGNTAAAGGGVYASGASTSPETTGDVTMNVSDTVTVTGNTADKGGGIFVEHGTANIIGKVDISHNTANLGGGIYLSDGIVNLTKTSGGLVNISYNTADQGGGMYIAEAEMTVTGTLSVNNNTAENGGGMYAENMNLYLSGILDVYKNNASINGGGIFAKHAQVQKSGTPQIIVIDNTAGFNGGGVYFEDGSATIDSHIEIKSNVAPQGAGLYIGQQERVVIKDGGLIQENHGMSGSSGVNANGGGVYIANLARLDMNGGHIDSNTSEGDGGGIYIGAGGACYMLYDTSIISANTAGNNGGGVYVDEYGGFYLKGGSVIHNTAIDGGGIYVTGEWAICDIDEDANENAPDIEYNTAINQGGGIYVGENAAFTLTGGSIGYNTADYGGGIYLHQGQRLVIKGAEITYNEAIYDGGGIWAAPLENVTADSDVKLSGNVAYERFEWDLDDPVGTFQQSLAALHATHILTDKFSISNNAYNNYDIYTRGITVYTMNIYFVDESGAEIGIPIVEYVAAELSYSKTAPAIAGYEAVGHYLNTLGALNSALTVVFEPAAASCDIYFVYKRDSFQLSITVPVKYIFVAFASDGGAVTSPAYTITNNSDFPVKVALHAFNDSGADGLMLVQVPVTDGQIGVNFTSAPGSSLASSINGVVLGIQPGNSGYMGELGSADSSTKVGKLHITGMYVGPFITPKHPKFNAIFRFTPTLSETP